MEGPLRQKKPFRGRLVGILSMLACAAGCIALLVPARYPVPAPPPARHYTLGRGSMGVETEYIDAGGSVELTVTDGTRKVRMTLPGGTVAEALERAGMELAPEDILSCGLEDRLYAGLTVEITRVTVGSVTEYEDIPFETLRIENDKKAAGETVVLREGAEGRIRRTYEVIYHNGTEYRRNLTETVREKEPVTQELEVGVYEPPVDDRENRTLTLYDGTVLAYTKRVDVSATAYTCEGQTWNITKTGTTARYGEIAVDPRYIPLNSKLYVVAPDGSWVYGFCIAEDTGGLIKRYRIDLYYDTYAECWAFGRRKACVYILPDDYEMPEEVLPKP